VTSYDVARFLLSGKHLSHFSEMEQSGYAVQVCLLHMCTVLFSLALDTTTFGITQAESKAGWTGLGVKSTVHPWLLHKCTVLFSSALATATYINLAIPHSTPFYCRTKATPILLAAPQSTLVFFVIKTKPFQQSHFPCYAPIYSCRHFSSSYQYFGSDRP
jgi:hypothetical protein